MEEERKTNPIKNNCVEMLYAIYEKGINVVSGRRVRFICKSEDQVSNLLQCVDNPIVETIYLPEAETYYQSGYTEAVYWNTICSDNCDALNYYDNVYTDYDYAKVKSNELYNNHFKEGKEAYKTVIIISKVHSEEIGDYYEDSNIELLDYDDNVDDNKIKTFYIYFRDACRVMSESKEKLIEYLTDKRNNIDGYYNDSYISTIRVPESSSYFITESHWYSNTSEDDDPIVSAWSPTIYVSYREAIKDTKRIMDNFYGKCDSRYERVEYMYKCIYLYRSVKFKEDGIYHFQRYNYFTTGYNRKDD
jgi:hypothetical protein